MTLSANKAKQLAKIGWLNSCLDTYFAPGQFVFDRSHLVDFKLRGDWCYAVMLFKVGDQYHVADVAGTGLGERDTFEVCNDGGDMDLTCWKTVRVDPHCDGYTCANDE